MDISLKDLGSLVTSDNIFEMMEWVVKITSDISKCGRVCFIAKEGEEFFVRAGIPENGHGIGKEISPEYGKNFLEQVMDKKKILVISNPQRDARLGYMRDLVAKYDISAVLFVPIFCENRDIGIIIADAVCMQNNFNLKQVKEFLVLSARVMGKGVERQEIQKKALIKARRDENLAVLGEHVSRISHTFGNGLNEIGPSAELIIEAVAESMTDIDPILKAKIIRSTKQITKKSKDLKKFVKEIKTFSETSDQMSFQKTNINMFLEEMAEAANLERKRVEVEWELDGHLNEAFVHLDQRYFGVCIYDILKNGVEAGATRFLVKTCFHAKQNVVKTIIGNNGKVIDGDDLNHIFSPFFTTGKSDGTGLGLAIASKIMAAHGGSIKARSNSKMNEDKHKFNVFFEISMPLNR
jgi:signal transduction histidine kinase